MSGCAELSARVETERRDLQSSESIEALQASVARTEAGAAQATRTIESSESEARQLDIALSELRAELRALEQRQQTVETHATVDVPRVRYGDRARPGRIPMAPADPRAHA